MIFFIGCGSSNYIYWKNNFKTQEKCEKSYGVTLDIPEYLYSGKIAGIKNNKIVFLNEKINEIPEDFFEKYLIVSLRSLMDNKNIKSYPWGFLNNKPKKVINVVIYDYLIDFDKKMVILTGIINNDNFKITKNFNKDYLKAYKNTFDELVLKIYKKIKECR
jgi:hypothetical protein